MNNILKIGCPVCGSVLSVQNQPGIESKSVTCPVCKNKSPFSAFRRIASNTGNASKEETTQYPNSKSGYAKEETETDIDKGPNYTLGKLAIPALGLSFQLKPGKNIIGRKASASSATCQIPCETKRMSREHLVIEIKKIPGKGFVHCASLYKEKVNPTFIGQNKLEYGDCVILHHRDLIRLPDVEARFEIPDNEATDI